MAYRRYMTLTELAQYIGVAVITLRKWKASRPDKLPPHINLSGGGRYDKWIFDSETVDRWLAGFSSEEQAVGL